MLEEFEVGPNCRVNRLVPFLPPYGIKLGAIERRFEVGREDIVEGNIPSSIGGIWEEAYCVSLSSKAGLTKVLETYY